jgi:hypothetical protein
MARLSSENRARWRSPMFEHGDHQQTPLVADPAGHFTKLAIMMRRQDPQLTTSSDHAVPCR